MQVYQYTVICQQYSDVKRLQTLTNSEFKQYQQTDIRYKELLSRCVENMKSLMPTCSFFC